MDARAPRIASRPGRRAGAGAPARSAKVLSFLKTGPAQLTPVLHHFNMTGCPSSAASLADSREHLMALPARETPSRVLRPCCTNAYAGPRFACIWTIRWAAQFPNEAASAPSLPRDARKALPGHIDVNIQQPASCGRRTSSSEVSRLPDDRGRTAAMVGCSDVYRLRSTRLAVRGSAETVLHRNAPESSQPTK